MSLTRASAKKFLHAAINRGSAIQPYEERGYQTTAAHKSAEALLGGNNAVLTLPTGTGKTLICGMTAVLYLNERPDARVLFTAPRKTLIAQLRDRSRWLGPTASTALVGVDPRDNDQRVIAAFDYAKLLFGMPEYLANRLASGILPSAARDRIDLVIVDEFDAFLTLRYQARGLSVSFHDSLDALRKQLPDTCRLLLVSATTPEIAAAEANADVEDQMDASAQSAFRSFLDKTFEPHFVTVSERYYAAFVPHAQIFAVGVHDDEVIAISTAIEAEVGLLLNWVSGMIGRFIDAAYVLPRLPQIREGLLGFWPGAPRRKPGGMLASLLGRLEKMQHLPDFLFEDMARDVTCQLEESWRYTADLEGKMPVEVNRIAVPAHDDGAMFAEPRGKCDALFAILARHAGERGIVFVRNIRILDVIAERLRADGQQHVIVHGKQNAAANDRALACFRATLGMLLLITRDTGKRGLDLPEGDFAIFYSPKAREDVTWQEVSRIRSTTHNPKAAYMLYYAGTREEAKMMKMVETLKGTSRSIEVSHVDAEALKLPSLARA